MQDLTDEALINRATFYSHYGDKQALLTKLTENTLGEFTSKMVLYTHVQEKQIELSKFEGILQSIFECIAKHADFYKSMLGPHGILFCPKLSKGILADSKIVTKVAVPNKPPKI
ncbi:TetR/AcrR family transcriptional regulator [Bacillus paramycoides]|nr:TetR/AcrR family transcriptional regulator [Bacillus paramycoides]